MNCILIDDEIIAINALKYYLAEEKDFRIVGVANNGEDALFLIRQLRPDLIFLDIQMPQMGGFELLQQIPREYMPHVIFVTAYDHYAVKAFEFHAMDYLLKPFTKERFQQATNRAKLTNQQAKKEIDIQGLLTTFQQLVKAKKYLQKIPIKQKSMIHFVHVSDIVWIESQGKFCKLHLIDGFKIVNRGLSELEGSLNPQKFLRTHKSYMVHLDYIATISPYFRGEYTIMMKNKVKLKLSRGYKSQLDRLLNQY